jgi:hypothetical protein
MTDWIITLRRQWADVCSAWAQPQTRAECLRRIWPWLLLFLFCYAAGWLLPEGFDWQVHFKLINIPVIWPPWTQYVMRLAAPFGYPLVFAITCLAIALRAYRYNRSPWPIALAVVFMPTLWVFFMGNVDGLVLAGLMVLPWGIPLVLMKPQVSAFALLARRRWLLAGIVWTLISVALWGFWPANLLVIATPGWRAEWVQDVSLFPWSVLLALPLLWFSRGDEDLLMAAGTLATPHLFPYHFILLAPALARMRPAWMILTWVIGMAVLPAANTYGDWAWHIANLMSLSFWAGIYFSRPKDWAPAPEKAWFRAGTWLRRAEQLWFGN